MALVDVFEATLKEAVQAKRLSARKMTELTEIAMKLMEHDTQLVSILYRTHKTLPPTYKVSSLYVFDALARAARHQVSKHSLTGNIYAEKGNCATFLLKVEGVLEGLFQDMMSSGTEESKEKSRKILDIWVKANTFPSPIMSRLTKLVKEPEKVTEAEQALPAASNFSNSTSPVPDTQAALLALLTQAATATMSTSSEQIPTNTIPPAPPSVDAVQLALLQQLAQKAITTPTTTNVTTAIPPRLSTDSPVPPFSPTGDRPPSPSSSKDSQRDDSKQSTEYDRYRSRSPDRTSTSEDYPDHRRSNFRGTFRGRGRGDPRGRWDDNDRFRDRRRRSRSRSPASRHPSRRDMKPYSPPGRQLTSSFQRHADSPDTSRSDGKDEFGRDIRPQSLENTDPTPNIPAYPTGSRSLAVRDPVVVSPSPASQNNEQVTTSPLVAANTSSNNSSAPFVSNTIQSQLGLDSFDPTSFNPTSPSSWELLGKMWQVTYGEMPTTEQLMQYVMHAMTGGQAPSASTVSPETQEASWGNSFRHEQLGGRGRGKFPGRGGSNGYDNNQNTWNRYDDSHTDAVVLGGSENDIESGIGNQSVAQEISRGTGGKMQKVGDKWVFIRDVETAQ